MAITQKNWRPIASLFSVSSLNYALKCHLCYRLSLCFDRLLPAAYASCAEGRLASVGNDRIASARQFGAIVVDDLFTIQRNSQVTP